MTGAETLFTRWESFYVIVGSSGAALTGLQFVVMALVAEAQRKGSAEAVNAYGTPTVVHFCMVLLTAAVLSAPWERVQSPAVILGLCGLAGIGYVAIVTARAFRQKDYKPVFEDWLWHCILPLVAYATLAIGAFVSVGEAAAGPFAIGASSLMLLFAGIHNAWDSVAYVATMQFKKEPPTGTRTPSSRR